MGGLERSEDNLTFKTIERLAEKLDCEPMALLRKR
jgi:hypothetical protein